MGQSGDKGPAVVPKSSTKTDIDGFLDAAAKLPAASRSARRGRLIFALDATMSRQATWDIAQSVQGRMFETAAAHGGLEVQLVYYRGFSECKASRFVGGRAESRASLMTQDRGRRRPDPDRKGSCVMSSMKRGPIAVQAPRSSSATPWKKSSTSWRGSRRNSGSCGVKAFCFRRGATRRPEQAFRKIAHADRRRLCDV